MELVITTKEELDIRIDIVLKILRQMKIRTSVEQLTTMNKQLEQIKSN